MFEGAAVRRSEAGETLVEVLVTVAVLGVAFVAILGGMSTSIMASDIHRKQATAETVLRNVAEKVKDKTLPYATVDCLTTYADELAPVLASVEGYAALVTGVAYLDDSNVFVDGCGLPADNVQRIAIRVESSDGRATETLEIVKRRP